MTEQEQAEYDKIKARLAQLGMNAEGRPRSTGFNSKPTQYGPTQFTTVPTPGGGGGNSAQPDSILEIVKQLAGAGFFAPAQAFGALNADMGVGGSLTDARGKRADLAAAFSGAGTAPLGDTGFMSGGGTTHGGGGSRVSSWGQSPAAPPAGPTYGKQAMDRDFERSQREKDMSLEEKMKKQAMVDRLNTIRDMIGHAMKLHSSTTKYQMFAGNMTPYTEKHTEEQSILPYIQNLLG